MKRLALIHIAILLGALNAWCYTLHGKVVDKGNGEAIEFATIEVTPGQRTVLTDSQGHYSISLEAGTHSVKVSFIGYKSIVQRITINQNRTLNFELEEDSKLLDEVVVTAKEQNGLTSTSRIDRDAMLHLQPTSFSDLLELLPGNISHTPDMGSVNTIQLRETGNLTATGTLSNSENYAISSLGTLFVVDGAPINGDANMQNVTGTGSDATQPESKRDMTNRGVDMRTISTDNIESVEIVRGIPSVEYGNLTSGMVNIKRVRRATPLTARFKADEYSKLVSVGKGFHLGKSDHIMNVDGSYLDSKVDPRNNLENYKRVTLSTRFNMRFNRTAVETAWITGVDYTGSFDNSKTDPDLSALKINEYKSRYNRINFTSDLTFNITKISWLKRVNLNTSASYQVDRLERRKQVAPQRASVAPTSMEEGVHDGQYLLNDYIASYVSDGKPLNIFLKLKGEGNFKLGIACNDYKLGGEWTLSKNYGDGQVYDLQRPLSASWVTRPRAYKDIPALKVLSFYAEDNLQLPLGKHCAELQAGLRTIQLVGLDSRYLLSGKMYFDPRVNAKWDFPAIRLGSRNLKLSLAGGYGVTTKMPTVSQLFPQVHYNDFIQLNYYDVLNPLEHSHVSLRTYIDDVTNYQLKPAVNHKWEVRLSASIGNNHFSITYFKEKMSSGFRNMAFYQPYAYTKYDANGIQAEYVTGPPLLDTIPSQAVTVLGGYSMVGNGSRLDKEGIEFTINTARWRKLATALTITGAWFRSTYTNSMMLYDPVSDVVDGSPVRNSYIGYYNYNEGRVNNRFNTNFMFDTQITRWGLVFTTTVQCMWWVSTRNLWQNGVPESYLDVADGQLHPYTTTSQSDPVLQFLTRTYNDNLFNTLTTPIALYVNLKATKKVGKHLQIAVFANRLIDYLPDYKSNGLMVRRTSDPYFGMELNFSL